MPVRPESPAHDHLYIADVDGCWWCGKAKEDHPKEVDRGTPPQRKFKTRKG